MGIGGKCDADDIVRLAIDRVSSCSAVVIDTFVIPVLYIDLQEINHRHPLPSIRHMLYRSHRIPWNDMVQSVETSAVRMPF